MMMINDGLQSSQEVWMITLLLVYPIFYFIMQKINFLNRAKQKAPMSLRRAGKW